MEKITLNKIANLIKSEWLLIVLGLFLIFIFIFYLISSLPNSSNIITWQNHKFAKVATPQSVETELGQPIKTEEKEGKLFYYYPSVDQRRPHQLEFENNSLSIIREQVIGTERGKLNDFIQKYGQPQRVLYGQHGTAAPGHFWGQNGTLVFANKIDGTIVEIWYFRPMTADSLISQNPQLSKEIPQSF